MLQVTGMQPPLSPAAPQPLPTTSMTSCPKSVRSAVSQRGTAQSTEGPEAAAALSANIQLMAPTSPWPRRRRPWACVLEFVVERTVLVDDTR